jgi:hypothetical protein
MDKTFLLLLFTIGVLVSLHDFQSHIIYREHWSTVFFCFLVCVPFCDCDIEYTHYELPLSFVFIAVIHIKFNAHNFTHKTCQILLVSEIG